MDMGVWVDLGRGRGEGGCVMHAASSRGSRAVFGAAGDVRRVLLAPGKAQKPACSRKASTPRERGTGGCNGGGGVPSS